MNIFSSFRTSFVWLKAICALNCMFFTSQLVQLVFLKKIAKNYNYMHIGVLVDLVNLVTSVLCFIDVTDVTNKLLTENKSDEDLNYQVLQILWDSNFNGKI